MIGLIESIQMCKSSLDRFGGKRTIMLMNAEAFGFGFGMEELFDVIVDDLADLVAIGWGADMTHIRVEDVGWVEPGFPGHGVENGAGWTRERDASGDLIFPRGFADHPDRG